MNPRGAFFEKNEPLKHTLEVVFFVVFLPSFFLFWFKLPLVFQPSFLEAVLEAVRQKNDAFF